MAKRASIANASAMPDAFGVAVLEKAQQDEKIKALFSGSFLERSVAAAPLGEFSTSYRDRGEYRHSSPSRNLKRITIYTEHKPAGHVSILIDLIGFVGLWLKFCTVAAQLQDSVDIPQALKRQDMSLVESEFAPAPALRTSLLQAAARWSVPAVSAVLSLPQVQVANLNFVDIRLGGTTYVRAVRIFFSFYAMFFVLVLVLVLSLLHVCSLSLAYF